MADNQLLRSLMNFECEPIKRSLDETVVGCLRANDEEIGTYVYGLNESRMIKDFNALLHPYAENPISFRPIYLKIELSANPQQLEADEIMPRETYPFEDFRTDIIEYRASIAVSGGEKYATLFMAGRIDTLEEVQNRDRIRDYWNHVTLPRRLRRLHERLLARAQGPIEE